MKLSRVFANLSVDIKEFVRNKAAVFWTLLFPVLLILLFGFIFSGEGDTTYDLPIQDNDGGFWSTNLTETLNNTDLFDVRMVDPSENPDDYVLDNDANIILIIPKGYSDDINQIMLIRSLGGEANMTANLTIKYDPAVSSTAQKIGILDSVIQGFNKGISGAQDTISFETETTISDQFEFIDFFAPGIIAMAVMSTSLFGTVMVNTELRQKGVLRKLATTPLARSEWLLSNILYQLVMSLFATVAILLVGVIVFDLHFSLNFFLALFIILDVFAFSGVGMLITRFVKEAQSAEAAANAVMFPMMFLAGTFFPLEMMPEFLQQMARIFPLYYVNEGLRSSMITLDFNQAWFHAAVIGVFGVVVFIMGMFLTSWKEE
ncbi:MAG: ABC transporter permease [Thermoplasmata archaeon]|nr:MAG: ABC transporter permease [Thermoplasmata archaeon]